MIATSLRSFLRFLRQEGLVDGRLEAAIPVVARPRLAALPAGLADSDLTRLLAATAASATPCAVRDHAIVTCLAALGLRPGELADLRLDDVDWRAGTLCVGAGKTRRGRVLPLPRDAGRALVVYLRTQRPVTSERRVFVQHRTAARGAALSSLAITQAVARALRRAGIEARIRGAYVLRHTLACRLVRHGTSLVEIADVLGHRSLDTTAVYARVDLAALREVALPWPAVTP